MYKNLLKFAMIPLKYLENPIVNGVLKIFLVFYAGAIAPKLPNFLNKLFNNTLVKMIILFLISYVGIKDPVMSLMIAVSFTLTMLSLNKLETLNDVHDLLDSVIDVPQEVLNELIDGTQELVKDGADIVDSITNKVGLKVAGPTIDMANMVIDEVQGVTNNVIDKSQEIVSGIIGTVLPKEEEVVEKESFSMKNEESTNVNFELGSLGDISGVDNDLLKQEEF